VTFTFSEPPIVVDASVAVEVLGANKTWVTAFEQWADDDRSLLAPAHFLAEVANAQLRGQRVPAADIAARLERLIAIGIEPADRGLPGLVEAVELAARNRLTVYDALYLQLALDVDGELATLDADLRRAAIAEGLQTTD
jgi:predicted nucleic acid-binding protein